MFLSFLNVQVIFLRFGKQFKLPLTKTMVIRDFSHQDKLHIENKLLLHEEISRDNKVHSKIIYYI
jgi:hypothetical protein